MAIKNTETNNTSNITNMQEVRLYKALDGISDRLGGIESQLSIIVRLEERLKSHEKALSRFGNRLDDHDDRVREMEIWQANRRNLGNTDQIDREITVLKDIINDLQTKSNVNKGQKDVGKELLKWAVGILTAVLIWLITEK